MSRPRPTIETEVADVVESEAEARARARHAVDRYVAKYMTILGVDGEHPVVKIRSHLGSRWLGRSTWRPSQPRTTLLELQQSILGDDRTLERVVAHEVIHHRDAIAISASEVALLRLGIRPESHGATFREGAARINAVMGPGFVTETSDQDYQTTSARRTFVVLITPLPGGRLGWSWTARLGPRAADWVRELVARGSRLVHTTDERWTRGRKIERYGGYSVPRDSQDVTLLQELYASATGGELTP